MVRNDTTTIKPEKFPIFNVPPPSNPLPQKYMTYPLRHVTSSVTWKKSIILYPVFQTIRYGRGTYAMEIYHPLDSARDKINTSKNLRAKHIKKKSHVKK